MRPDKLSLSQLFNHSRRYVIPLFQRGYVWTLEDNWEPLWMDIVGQTERLREAGTGASDGLQRHFLGAIVLAAEDARVRHVTDHGVIDGQQRLTTLQLLLAAFRDVVAPLQDEDLTRELTKLTVNEGKWQVPDESFKVWPTVAGRELFRELMTTGSRAEVERKHPPLRHRKKTLARPPLVEAYLFFSTKIEQYLRGASLTHDDAGEPVLEPSAEPSPPDAERARYLLEALTSYFQLVAVELDDDDDPQVIFETLNARMVPLTASDLIRNYVFLEGMRKDLDLDQLYFGGWDHFESDPTSATDSRPYWPGVTKQGRRNYRRMDLLCFHYVTMRTGREVQIKQIFHAFQDWWRNGDVGVDGRRQPVTGGRDPHLEVRRLRRASDDLRIYLGPTTAGGARGLFAERLRALDLTTPYPLLLFIDERRDQLSTAEYDGLLEDIESYLVRRAVVGLTQKNYNRTFPELLAKVRGAAPGDMRATLRSALRGYQGDSSVWPDDPSFMQALVGTPLYQNQGPVKTQMLLKALERTFRSGFEENLPIPVLTIEHVLPQSPRTEEWPYEPGVTPGIEAAIRRAQLCHSLGNLTLLSGPLNSYNGNGPFREKRKAIAEHSQLRMNTFFQTYPRETWFESDILARGEDLARRALGIWKRR